MIHQTISLEGYKKICRDEICSIVTTTNDKKKLYFCIKNFYITLMCFGYTREHIYICTKRFFNNKAKTINRLNQIEEFLNGFSCEAKEYSFYALVDIINVEYIEKINPDLKDIYNIKLVEDNDELRALGEKDDNVGEMLHMFDKLKRSPKEHSRIEIVEVNNTAMDPHQAIVDFIEYLEFVQVFKRYFIHHQKRKQFFLFLLKDSNKYIKIRPHVRSNSRPYTNSQLIDERISYILNGDSLSSKARSTIMHAMQMHAEVLNAQSASTKLKTLWTALESLFLDYTSSVKENTNNCVLAIIQKTYILKLLRAIYAAIESALSPNDMKELGIENFKLFVQFFASNSFDSNNMKSLYELLKNNPLLRSRIYNLRKELSDGKMISKFLSEHEIRIRWQLDRILRMRNIVTHIGKDISGLETATIHLHDYFDYVINYIICKSENEKYVTNTVTVAFEAKNDNQIHNSILKCGGVLNSENYLEYLFGPDSEIINYKFEY